jgi:hypothetical protein
MNAAKIAATEANLDNAGLEIVPTRNGAAISAQTFCRHLPTVERHPLNGTAYSSASAARSAAAAFFARA